ncbi:helix-turn-helix domain-containing protein [Candidatus Daviesbacteria bacterium]|nr:helix-turn-helix domain-containing protein [Candidatus Daviesbacteria bacterium]
MMVKDFNGTAVANSIFCCVYEIQQRFGLNYIALILVGSNSQKILKYSHNQLDVYGALKQYPLEQVKIWIKELIEKGYLTKTQDEYPVIKLLDKANLAQSGKEQVELTQPDPNLKADFSFKGESAAKTFELFKQGKTVEEIAQERKLAQTTVLNHLAYSFEKGEQIDINQFVSKEKQQTIAQSFQKLGLEFLAPVKQSLDPSFSWEDLKWVRAKLIRDQSKTQTTV